MSGSGAVDFVVIRDFMASFDLSPKVEPNATIEHDRAFFPESHRGVLDFKRQLVVGNRGMGKSFWTHALLNPVLKQTLAHVYVLPALARTEVVVGFNASEKIVGVAPTTDDIAQALNNGCEPDLIWRAVLLRAAIQATDQATPPTPSLSQTLSDLARAPEVFTQTLSVADNVLAQQNRSLLVVFDALERLAPGWDAIRALTKGLLVRGLGLQSFRAIRMKIFMRIDQFADADLFRFPESSKVKNDKVDLTWQPFELYGLLLFELLRHPGARQALKSLARRTNTGRALPHGGRLDTGALQEQVELVNGLAGEFMSSHKKRGRVYTWVPLHLGDARNDCSPRTFLTAWRSAANHPGPPVDRAVDHLGLIEGVRRASSTRLAELREDYPWIDAALEPLRRQFVPIPRDDLFALWDKQDVIARILSEAKDWLAPIDLFVKPDPDGLLDAMVRIAVMDRRTTGKINVPDIFRVEAEILRRGGVAVPSRI